jgi:hypothetical protein
MKCDQSIILFCFHEIENSFNVMKLPDPILYHDIITSLVFHENITQS